MSETAPEVLEALGAMSEGRASDRARINAATLLHDGAADWSWRTFGCQHDGAHERLCPTCRTCWPCDTLRALWPQRFHNDENSPQPEG